MMKMILQTAALAALQLLLSCGVSGGSSDREDNGLTEAWSLFEQELYPEAQAAFQDLIDAAVEEADANNGKGWSQFHQLDATGADRSFDRSLAEDPLMLDSRAGRAFANRELASGSSLSDARQVLASAPDWSFAHNSAINQDDLHVLMAQLFFYSHSLDSCLAHCLAVDGTMTLSPADSLSWGGSPSFEAALFNELARLSSLVAD